ncbi:MAG TPA: hypothetical protein PLQ27_02215 [Candidatus Paceibacterota bacterium]|nr:hypothetical protein [Candidatus Paceibacterota bacterium]
MVENYQYDSLKVKPLPPAWPRGLLIFFIVLLALTIGLNFFLQIYLNREEQRLAQLDNQLEELKNQLPIDKQLEVIKLERKIDTLNQILTDHIYFSYFFDWLESITPADVYYDYLTFTGDNLKVSLSGQAKDNEILAQTVYGAMANQILNSTNLIDGVILRDLERRTQTSDFSLDIYLKKEGLNFQSEGINSLQSSGGINQEEIPQGQIFNEEEINQY